MYKSEKSNSTKKHIKSYIERILVIRSFLSNNGRYKPLFKLRQHPFIQQLKYDELPEWVEFYYPVHGEILIITPDDDPIDLHYELLYFVDQKYKSALIHELCLN